MINLIVDLMFAIAITYCLSIVVNGIQDLYNTI